MMGGVAQLFAWGADWSPITVVDTGSVLTAVYYPHKATGDLMVTARGHAFHCCICGEDIAGTKPHTRHEYRMRAFIDHLRVHGRRTRKRNRWIVAQSDTPHDGEGV